MSNHNHQQNPANNGGNAAPANNGPEKKPEEKKTLIQRALHLRDKIKANKFGRIAIKGAKALGVGGLTYGAYRYGKKSVKPTTIYIREGVTEEEESPAETPAEAEATEE